MHGSTFILPNKVSGSYCVVPAMPRANAVVADISPTDRFNI